ncbi:MAG: asparagine synthase-related protein [Brevundimonas aurantiaca]|uniref:asparagine synthase-related protein n=1 Tax=Brevundimonas aurantiaca TaxID=74316 RepID=UPI003919F256
MPPFALIASKVGLETADRIDRFGAAAVAQGWRAMPLSRSVVLAVGPGAALNLQSLGAWRLVGDVFPRRGEMTGEPKSAADLISQVWGRYVAFQLREDGRLAAVLRDPSGALDALLLHTADHWIVASDLPDWLLAAVRPALQIDNVQVAGVLQDPTRAWDVSLLNGVNSVTPGACLNLEDRPVAHQVWRPSAFVDTASGLTLDAAGEWLREVVDEAVSNLSERAGVLATELSGGLDSGIVATSLARLDSPVRAWLHSYGSAPESDERSFALPLAQRLGATLDLLKRPDTVLSQQDLQGLSLAFRPGFNAMDPVNDGIAAARLKALGIETVLTGKGGDAVFFQAFGEEVFADLWKRQGVRALVSSTLPAVARWEGRSIFSVVAGRKARPSDPQAGFLPPDAPALAPHPWLETAQGVGPAKRLQIVGMLDGAGFSAASRQTQVADIRHPLLSQPVMEACLAIPADQLTLGRDRGLARLAFAARLTPQIATRRSKGDLTAYYGRLIARSLDVLRPWLLDGELAARGLIDRGRADRALSAEQLIWRGGYRDIMVAAAMESWLRTWRSRLEALEQASP